MPPLANRNTRDVLVPSFERISELPDSPVANRNKGCPCSNAYLERISEFPDMPGRWLTDTRDVLVTSLNEFLSFQTYRGG